MRATKYKYASVGLSSYLPVWRRVRITSAVTLRVVKRRQKGNSRLKFCLNLDLTVSTARYRSVLSSERAPYITIQVNVRVKEI
jgi:hypothetical protein